MCEYCEKGSYYGFCVCVKSGDICPFMRRCNIEHEWLPIDLMDACSLRKPKEVIELNKNEYKVRFEKDGYLYIEIGDVVIQKRNPYDHVPSKVEMVRIDNELYFKGFESKDSKEQIKFKKKNK